MSDDKPQTQWTFDHQTIKHVKAALAPQKPTPVPAPAPASQPAPKPSR